MLGTLFHKILFNSVTTSFPDNVAPGENSNNHSSQPNKLWSALILDRVVYSFRGALYAFLYSEFTGVKYNANPLIIYSIVSGSILSMSVDN